jgi:phthiocerol/phenolphthiocerol synthesis type-I polyketide synthase E
MALQRRKLVNFENSGTMAMSNCKSGPPSGSIAVIGMAGRFPGAPNVEAFWKNLVEGRESIRRFSTEELLSLGDFSESGGKEYVPCCGFLDGIEWLDAGFFGLTPAEAEMTAPEHRLLLECAWEALESAGYPSAGERVGVFAGTGFNYYLHNHVLPNCKPENELDLLHLLAANEKDNLTTRIGFKLDLRGPCLTIQTSCSSSLVAVHVACQSLLNGECDLALAGGASIGLPQTGYAYQEGSIMSPDGHCRPFDARAKGTVPGSGVALVLLKRADEACAARDTVHALIRGTAVNNDGATKVGYTAPSVQGHVAVVTEALAVADVDPDSIGYIETHGTGTAIGDPIEMRALTEAYQASKRQNPCAIGFLKANIGHLDAAAGVAGLIKTILILRNQMLPPGLHFKSLNPQIDFPIAPFFMNTALRAWSPGVEPRRAAVSSLGVGGTNVHAILEEAPAVETVDSNRKYHLLPLSARSAGALDVATDNLAMYLQEQGSAETADVAFTLQAGRRAFAHRRAVVAGSHQEAVAALQSSKFADARSVCTSGSRPIVFLFPGQGAQYVQMGRGLYESEPSFRESVDKGCDLLRAPLGLDLRRVLYPSVDGENEAAQTLVQTNITQPALFIIEYAMAKLWMEWGVHPQAMIGHSIGEYVAACLAGVLTYEDGLMLVAERGRLMQMLPAGAMLAVLLEPARMEPILGDELSIASENGPESCVVSGAAPAIVELEAKLKQIGVPFRRLRTSHAFHSAMMIPILNSFASRVALTKLQAPAIPYISNVSGDWVRKEQATDPGYWAAQLRQAVLFHKGIETLKKQFPRGLFIEVGPGQTLSALLAQSDLSDVRASMRHPGHSTPDGSFLMETVGQLWSAGVNIDWNGFWKHEHRRRVHLPTYAFERKRYWLDPPKRHSGPAPPSASRGKATLVETIEYQLQEMIRQLQELEDCQPRTRPNSSVPVEVPLLPAQAWFLEQSLVRPDHYNYSFELQLGKKLTGEVAGKAVAAAIAIHEALRTRYRKTSAGWRAIIEQQADANAFKIEDVPVMELHDAEAAVMQIIARTNTELNIQTGPVFKAVLIEGPTIDQQRLILVCHHLAIDLFSAGVLLNDLETEISQRAELSRVECPYSTWATRLESYAQSPEAKQEMRNWADPARRSAKKLPVDSNICRNTEESAATLEVFLPAPESAELASAAASGYGVLVGDILLTALSVALTRWAGGPVLVDVESHGREDLFPDLTPSRTVGWLTAIYPLLLEVSSVDDPAEAVRRMSAKRGEIPFGGIGYGLLRYLSRDKKVTQTLASFPQSQVSFNHVQSAQLGGRGLFKNIVSHQEKGLDRTNHRRYLVELECGMREQRMCISMRYSNGIHHPDTILRLTSDMHETLMQLIHYAIRMQGTHSMLAGPAGIFEGEALNADVNH